MPILALDDVSKTYGRRLVLHDIDLVLAPGSFSVVVGANGSGKTTLLRLMSTYAKPTTGRVRWGPPAAADPSLQVVRGWIGYAGHTPLVYDELTVRENLEFQLRMRGRPSAEAPEALESFNLSGRSRDRAQTLSRGLRQRLGLAQAFAARPRILLLDEPTAGLDASGIRLLLAALKAQGPATTSVVATHDADAFRPLADRTLEIHGGTVRTWGGKR